MTADESQTTAALRNPTDEQRMARLQICRAASAMEDALKLMDARHSHMVLELQNMVGQVLRLALHINDDGISAPSKLRIW